MSPTVFILTSSAVTFGVPLALAIREVVALRPKPEPPRRNDPPPPPAPRRPRGDDAPAKPLPACLLPPYPTPPPSLWEETELGLEDA